jgi:hypothetical protein
MLGSGKTGAIRGFKGSSFSLDPLALILSRPGQILIPSLLIIPMLMLFIYLIFETTKLSREKIRQQFALDTAAFIQMGDYTNIFNRTAYVNGAFPYRIFKEAYDCFQGCTVGTEENCLRKTGGVGAVCTYKMLYEAGAIPKYTGDEAGQQPTPLDNKPQWDILFSEPPRGAANKNPPDVGDTLTLITSDQGVHIYIFWDPAVGIYKFYAQVYTLLGTVEESQMTVFERLTENFNFFRKAYYLNANTAECVKNPNICGEDGLRSRNGYRANRLFRGSNMFMHYIKHIVFHAKVPQVGLPPYFLGKTAPPMDMTSSNPNGLFQLASFSASALEAVGKGYAVFQGWEPPTNYFNVRFDRMKWNECENSRRPCVHALVASQCPNLQGGWPNSTPNNCVWPNPTPKYQTRLYP